MSNLKTKIGALLATVGILAFAACSNVLDGTPDAIPTPAQSNLLSVKVEGAGAGARTTGPATAGLVYTYQVGTAAEAELVDGAGNITLDNGGPYTISFRARASSISGTIVAEKPIADIVVAGGVITGTGIADNALALAFATGDLTTGDGTLSFSSVAFTGAANGGTIKLFDDAGAAVTTFETNGVYTVTNADTAVPDDVTLASGRYIVEIKLLSGTNVAYYNEVAVVWAGLKTTLTFDADGKYGNPALSAATAYVTAEDLDIAGTVDAALAAAVDIPIKLFNGAFSAPIAQGASVAGWITNLPAGLTAVAKTAVAISDQDITITVAGTPTAYASELAFITIPGTAVGGASPANDVSVGGYAVGVSIKVPLTQGSPVNALVGATTADVTFTGDATALAAAVGSLTAADFTISADLGATFTSVAASTTTLTVTVELTAGDATTEEKSIVVGINAASTRISGANQTVTITQAAGDDIVAAETLKTTIDALSTGSATRTGVVVTLAEATTTESSGITVPANVTLATSTYELTVGSGDITVNGVLDVTDGTVASTGTIGGPGTITYGTLVGITITGTPGAADIQTALDKLVIASTNWEAAAAALDVAVTLAASNTAVAIKYDGGSESIVLGDAGITFGTSAFTPNSDVFTLTQDGSDVKLAANAASDGTTGPSSLDVGTLEVGGLAVPATALTIAITNSI
jgi:hypothetical protein